MERSPENIRVSYDLLDEDNSSSPLFGHSTTTPHNIEDEEVEHGNKDVPTAETENRDASLPKVGSKRQRTSKAWQHFNLEEEVKDNKRLPVGICKYCNAKYDGRGTTGTSNLLRHLDKCREYKKLNSSAASGKEIDQTVFRQLVAEAVIRHGYSFCWVEHEATRKLFKYLNDRVEPISRNTVKKDCLEVHLAVKGKLMHVLKEIPGRICLTSDMWTACTSQGYLCVTAHYIDANWKLHCKLLCFRHCAPPHGGYELSVEIGNVLLEWGIGGKIFSLTVDNASNMGKAVSNLKGGVLKELLCKGKYFHVRCSAYILNLIVKKGLGVIDGSISKLREGIKYINGSEARKQRFLDLFRNSEVSYSSALWMDVETRWNSTYMMIERALKYREVLHHYFADMDGLSVKYHLTQEEWVKIEKIFDLLEPFYEITNLFSGSDYPTANLYFPQVFLIYCRIRKAMASDDIDISLTAEQMMEKFDKYWHDYVLVLAFAVIFDPRYKLKFVEFALCGTHGKDEGGRMAKEVYAQLLTLYKEYAALGGVSDSPCTERVRSETEFQYDRIEEFELFDSCEHPKCELDNYLGETRSQLSENLDVLDFWKGNSTRFPVVSAMARDILAIPITTVASESTFSMGGRILNKWRSSLLDDNVEALVTTKNWLTGYDVFTKEGVSVALSSRDSG